MIDEFIFDEWSEDLIVMMIAGALSEIALPGVTTCEEAVLKFFPSKTPYQFCKSTSFNPITLQGQMNLVDVMLYQHSDLKLQLVTETGY